MGFCPEEPTFLGFLIMISLYKSLGFRVEAMGFCKIWASTVLDFYARVSGTWCFETPWGLGLGFRGFRV